jgi:hypothetical protein
VRGLVVRFEFGQAGRGPRLEVAAEEGDGDPRSSVQGGAQNQKCRWTPVARLSTVDITRYRAWASWRSWVRSTLGSAGKKIERDSWSGWRRYSDPQHTTWTETQRQEGAPVSDLCPQGRTGTYNYRLAIRIEVDGITVGESWAASPLIRTDAARV